MFRFMSIAVTQWASFYVKRFPHERYPKVSLSKTSGCSDCHFHFLERLKHSSVIVSTQKGRPYLCGDQSMKLFPGQKVLFLNQSRLIVTALILRSVASRVP